VIDLATPVGMKRGLWRRLLGKDDRIHSGYGTNFAFVLHMIKRRLRFAFSSVLLFVGVINFGHLHLASAEQVASPSHAESKENTKSHAAGVAWVGGDDPDKRIDFETESAQRMERFACGSNSILKIPANQYFELSKRQKDGRYRTTEALTALSENIDKALSSLQGKKHPELHILLTVHGGDGVLCPSYYQRNLDNRYEELFKNLITKLDAYRSPSPSIKDGARLTEDPQVFLYFNVCESYSAKEPLKRSLTAANGRYSNGKDPEKFKYPIDLIAGSDVGKQSSGHTLWYTMQGLGETNQILERKRGDTFLNHEDWANLCTFETTPENFVDEQNQHRVWSSHHSFEEKDLPEKAFSSALELLSAAANSNVAFAVERELLRSPLEELTLNNKQKVLAAIQNRMQLPGGWETKWATLFLVQKLGLSSDELQDFLLPLLNHSSPETRAAVLDSDVLKGLQKTDLKELILRKTYDPDNEVNYRAVRVLSDADIKALPKEQVITAAKAILKRKGDPGYPQEKAIEWLDMLGHSDPNIVDYLFAVIKKPQENSGPAEAALKYLSKFYPNDPRFTAALLDAAQRKHPYFGLRHTALEVIRKGDGKNKEIVEFVKKSLTEFMTASEAVDALERIKGEVPFEQVESALRLAAANDKNRDSARKKAVELLATYPR
jgi:hypothetical protein